MVGLSHTKVKSSYEYVSKVGVLTSDAVSEEMKKIQFVPMARIAYSYDFTDFVGMRATVGWKQMSKFRLQPDFTGANKENAQLHMKDRYTFGLGVYVRPFNLSK